MFEDFVWTYSPQLLVHTHTCLAFSHLIRSNHRHGNSSLLQLQLHLQLIFIIYHITYLTTHLNPSDVADWRRPTFLWASFLIGRIFLGNSQTTTQRTPSSKLLFQFSSSSLLFPLPTFFHRDANHVITVMSSLSCLTPHYSAITTSFTAFLQPRLQSTPPPSHR